MTLVLKANKSLKPTKSKLSIWLVGVLLIGSLILTWVPDLDDAAQDYLSDAISDNLVVYATARTINALISVIQSIEVSVSLGAGVAVNLGEALDPINDLIERFSGFILYGLAGLGLQQLVLTASSSIFIKAVLTLALVAGYFRWLLSPGFPAWAKKVLIFLLFVRFAFAVEVGVSWVLDKAYFDAQQQDAISTLDIAQNRLQEIRDEYVETIDEKGVFSGIWSAAKSIIGTDEEKGTADLAAEAVVQLIVIMVVRSILLPIFFVWLLFYFFRRMIPE